MTNYEVIFKQFPVLETERLILRAFEEKDIADFYNMCLASDYIDEFLEPGMCISKVDAHNNIMLIYPQSFAEKVDLTWAVTLKSNGKIIGVRDLFIDSPYDPIITQGYIASEYRNQGYNQEVLRSLKCFLKKVNADSLIINCSTSNHPVMHIADKLGFTNISNFQVRLIRGRCKYMLDLKK